MPRYHRTQIWGAFDKLGLSRVLKGARALRTGWRSDGWEGCFLAMAYGEKHEFSRLSVSGAEGTIARAARELGISRDDALCIMGEYDNEPDVLREEMEEWRHQHLTRLLAEGSVPPRKPDQVERFIQQVETGTPIEERVPVETL